MQSSLSYGGVLYVHKYTDAGSAGHDAMIKRCTLSPTMVYHTMPVVAVAAGLPAATQPTQQPLNRSILNQRCQYAASQQSQCYTLITNFAVLRIAQLSHFRLRYMPLNPSYSTRSTTPHLSFTLPVPSKQPSSSSKLSEIQHLSTMHHW